MASEGEQSESAITDDAPFETVLHRLEGVVERLEGGELSLEDSLAVFEEGIRLSRLGARRLDEAEQRVEVLLAGTEGQETEALDEES